MSTRCDKCQVRPFLPVKLLKYYLRMQADLRLSIEQRRKCVVLII